MGKSAPAPTDPKKTSAAQTGTSVSTSIANAYLQNMNETTADGTKTFDQTGDYSFTDPYTNESYTVPRFSVTQTLSEAQQGIKDQNDRASLNLSTLGADLSGTLGNQLTDNFQLGNEETESRLILAASGLTRCSHSVTKTCAPGLPIRASKQGRRHMTAKWATKASSRTTLTTSFCCRVAGRLPMNC